MICCTRDVFVPGAYLIFVNDGVYICRVKSKIGTRLTEEIKAIDKM
jgi:hypothetical protein